MSVTGSNYSVDVFYLKSPAADYVKVKTKTFSTTLNHVFLHETDAKMTTRVQTTWTA